MVILSGGDTPGSTKHPGGSNRGRGRGGDFQSAYRGGHRGGSGGRGDARGGSGRGVSRGGFGGRSDARGGFGSRGDAGGGHRGAFAARGYGRGRGASPPSDTVAPVWESVVFAERLASDGTPTLLRMLSPEDLENLFKDPSTPFDVASRAVQGSDTKKPLPAKTLTYINGFAVVVCTLLRAADDTALVEDNPRLRHIPSDLACGRAFGAWCSLVADHPFLDVKDTKLPELVDIAARLLRRFEDRKNNELLHAAVNNLANRLRPQLEGDNKISDEALRTTARDLVNRADRIEKECRARAEGAHAAADAVGASAAAAAQQQKPVEERGKCAILPRPDELHQNSHRVLQRLPRVVINAPIESIEWHIDVHFQLSREDFLLSLRDGVSGSIQRLEMGPHGYKQLNEEQRNDLRKREIQVHRYEGVEFKGTQLDEKNGVLFKFRATQPQSAGKVVINWLKRFMHGNLVLIWRFDGRTSLNEDKPFVCGTVVRYPKPREKYQRDPILDGQFMVSFADTARATPTAGSGGTRDHSLDIGALMQFFEPHRRYFFIESKQFFLPTNRVLRALRDETTPAALDGVLEALTHGRLKTPRFLEKRGRVDLSSALELVQDAPRTTIDIGNGDVDAVQMDARQICAQWTIEGETALAQAAADVKKPQLKHIVDETQRQALALALSHNVALIKGTPGTGKTFIGAKIVQLFENNDLLTGGPMLVLALTNHAVDSFARDLLLYVKPQHIVRLGRPSEDPVLKEQQICLRDKELPRLRGFREIREEMADLADEFAQVRGRLIGTLGKKSDVTAVAEKDLSNCPELPQAWRQHLRAASRTAEHDRHAAQSRLDQGEARVERAKRDLEAALRTRQAAIEQVIADQFTYFYNFGEDLFTQYYTTIEELKAHAKAQLSVIPGVAVLGVIPHVMGLMESYAEELDTLVTPLFQQPPQARVKPAMAPEGSGGPLASYDNDVRDAERALQQVQAQVAPLRAAMEQAKSHVLSAWVGDARTKRTAMAAAAAAVEEDSASSSSDDDDGDGAAAANGGSLTDDDVEIDDMARYDEELEQERRFDAAAPGTGAGDASAETLIDTRLPQLYTAEELKAGRRWLEEHSPAACDANPALRSEAAIYLRREVQAWLHRELNEVAASYGIKVAQLRELDGKATAELFASQKVIIGTTAAVHQMLPAIRSAKVRVVMVEEVGEVPEAHILAAITNTVEQLILIGDDRQLEPKLGTIHLEKKNLAVSLLARLVNIGAPSVTLTAQRRMHEQISNFVKSYYDRVERVTITDHPCTQHREPVRGIRDGVRACFIDTTDPAVAAYETFNQSMQSFVNVEEAKYVMAVVRYLRAFLELHQITILVTYKAQLLHMFELAKQIKLPWSARHQEGCVRLATIDDYQGEESDVVLISLVRTSEQGFLYKENRACVALSRARRFMAIFGSTAMLQQAKKPNPLWLEAIERCRTMGTLGPRFPAYCPFHDKDLPFTVRDMTTVLNANLGCKGVRCNVQLDCGHLCPQECHPGLDPEHHDVFCKEPCTKHCERGHRCPKLCGDDCGGCMEIVKNVTPPCGEEDHAYDVKCFQVNPDHLPPCRVTITGSLPCGHEVNAPCGEWMSGAADALQKRCKQKCGAHLDCGHICEALCHHGKDHPRCKQAVKNATRPCGHGTAPTYECFRGPPQCKDICSAKLRDCKHTCALRCGHEEYQQTPHDCAELEPVTDATCGHQVMRRCVDPSNVLPCDNACGAKLACGHTCSSKCAQCRASTTSIGIFAHGACQAEKTITLPWCGHSVTKGCSDASKPCQTRCARGCVHHRKSHKHECGQCNLPSCKMSCVWKCPHQKCTRACGEDCNRDRCVEPCHRPLSCGHPCPGVCGEECPSVCLSCCLSADSDDDGAAAAAAATDERERLPANLVLLEAYVFKEDVLDFVRHGRWPEDLLADPLTTRLVKLPCDHCFFAGELEKHIESAASDAEVRAPACPQCRAPIASGDVLFLAPHLRKLERRCIAVAHEHRDPYQKRQAWLEEQRRGCVDLIRRSFVDGDDTDVNCAVLARAIAMVDEFAAGPEKPERRPFVKKGRDTKKHRQQQRDHDLKWDLTMQAYNAKLDKHRESLQSELTRLEEDLAADTTASLDLPIVREAARVALITLFILHRPDVEERVTAKGSGDRDMKAVEALTTGTQGLVNAARAASAASRHDAHRRGALSQDSELARLGKDIQGLMGLTVASPADVALATSGELRACCTWLSLYIRSLAVAEAAAASARTATSAGVKLIPAGPPRELPGDAQVTGWIDACTKEAVGFVNSPAARRALHRKGIEPFFIENPCLRRRCNAFLRFVNGLHALNGNTAAGVTLVAPTDAQRCRLAFHGTPADSVSAILCQGLDQGRRSGQAHGPGEYFGAQIEVSEGYARGAEMMLVCLVLEGPHFKAAGNNIFVVNSPADQRHVQYALPLGVVVYGRIDDPRHCQDFDKCLAPSPIRQAHVDRLRDEARGACRGLLGTPRAAADDDDSSEHRENEWRRALNAAGGFEQRLKREEKHYAVVPATPLELMAITKAIGLTSGHAYQCPNGHIYFIGDCGGAMVRSTCPDCGATIGGESHQATEGNTFAGSRFDSGAAPSWPTGDMR